MLIYISGSVQKKVVIVQPISNGRFTIIPQETQAEGQSKDILFSVDIIYISKHLYRVANTRVCACVLADLGGGAGTLPPVAADPAQWRRPPDGGGHEVRLHDPADGHVRDRS